VNLELNGVEHPAHREKDISGQSERPWSDGVERTACPSQFAIKAGMPSTPGSISKLSVPYLTQKINSASPTPQIAKRKKYSLV